MNTKRKGFFASEDGAVMIMGVFMALALVGVIWFLLGIGASIVFREKMQEGADAGAFSSAAVHARSMNFIVVINLVMFALATFWLLLCITYAVLFVVVIYTTVIAIVSCLVGCEGVAAAEGAEDLREQVKQMKDQYKNLLSSLLPMLSKVQTYTAEFADVGGVIVSFDQVADTTGGELGFAASPDLPNFQAGNEIGGRIGLPVENEKNGALCRHSSEWVLGYLQTLIEKNPIAKKLVSLSTLEIEAAGGLLLGANPKTRFALSRMESALNTIRNATSDSLQFMFCSDDFWKEAGPKRMWRNDKVMEKNASDWMQVYSVVVPSGLDDNRAEHQIGVSHLDTSKKSTVPFMFFAAQAEYFLDCEGKWDSGSCNAISDEVKDTDIDASMYRLEWRARLVRLHTPKNMPAAKVINGLNSMLAEGAVLKNAQNNSPAVQRLLGGLPPEVLDFFNKIPSANFH